MILYVGVVALSCLTWRYCDPHNVWHLPQRDSCRDQLLDMAQMTFDEQLSRVADGLTGRLRDEIAQHVQAVAADISAMARADRDQAAADARTAAERRAAEQIAAAVADAEARAFAFGQDAGLQEGRTAGSHDAAQAVVRLVDATRTMDAARSLTAILDALAASAAAEAARSIVLLVRGDRARVWRQLGFDAAFPSPSDGEFVLGEDDVLREVVTKNVIASGDRGPLRAPEFAGSDWTQCVCAPIALASEVVAVLYADRNDDTPRPGWPSRVELLARHATRCLEAVVAFKAARMLAAPPHSGGPNVDVEPTTDEETGARRYARLLVSEIRLYHEDAVAAGRREGDLATRLGGEIARARMLYEQRVAPRVRRRADYFHDELVRTLADGNPALLELRT